MAYAALSQPTGLFCYRVALAKARKLIEDCGYGRRLSELADAEAAAEHWPESTE